MSRPTRRSWPRSWIASPRADPCAALPWSGRGRPATRHSGSFTASETSSRADKFTVDETTAQRAWADAAPPGQCPLDVGTRAPRNPQFGVVHRKRNEFPGGQVHRGRNDRATGVGGMPPRPVNARSTSGRGRPATRNSGSFTASETSSRADKFTVDETTAQRGLDGGRTRPLDAGRRRPRPAEAGRRRSTPADAGRLRFLEAESAIDGDPGIELGSQAGQGRLIAEGDVEGMAVDGPELGRGEADLVEGSLELVGERQIGDGGVVGRQGDRNAGTVESGEGMVGDRGDKAACQFEVGQRSRVMARSASSRQSARSSIVAAPWAMRAGFTASARRTCGAPPHSPAWTVTRRPPARAAANASAWSIGSGYAASGPARSHPVKPSSMYRAAVVASVAFASGSCERRAVQINRTTVPVRAAASAAPRATASMPSSRERPRATWSNGPHRIST